MPTVLLSAPYMIPLRQRFEPFFAHYGLELIVPPVAERMSEDELLRYAGQFDGAVCGDDRFTPRVLQACLPRLKVISKWGTGIDSIDRVEALRLGIQVRNTPNAFTLPVSDSTLGYMLSYARRLPWMDRHVKSGQWEKLPGRSLSECTLGVVGVGNVGKAVLRRARAFGMQLLGNDIIPIAPDFLLEYQVEMTSLEDLLRRSDFVSLHVDLNPTSYHLINPQTLSYMKPTAVLINTSRGDIIDEAALYRALQSGRLAGAALDVFCQQPPDPSNPLLSLPNVLVTPHMGAHTDGATNAMGWISLRDCLSVLRGEEPKFRVS